MGWGGSAVLASETLHPLSVGLGAFPRRRAARTPGEYRRRGNSFNLVPSHIQMSNSETKVVVFLSVNRFLDR